jgi:hypothetical protein
MDLAAIMLFIPPKWSSWINAGASSKVAQPDKGIWHDNVRVAVTLYQGSYHSEKVS